MLSAGPILLVEDDLESLQSLADLLSAGGYTVIATADGAEAMRHLREDHPRLVLLDLQMPRMDGWEFSGFKNQDAVLARIPVVLLSGARDLKMHAVTLDAAAWLQKPFSPAHLLEVVRTVLAAAEV